MIKTKKSSTKPIKLLAITILAILILFVSTSLLLNYYINPTESYKVDSTNLIEDGGFENFDEGFGDCYNPENGNSGILVSFSTDAYSGVYSLKLISTNNQIACISKKIPDFDSVKKYILSFEYKGDNPRVCGWTTIAGGNKCIPNKLLNKTKIWAKYQTFLEYPSESDSSSIYLYADSSGTPVINYYDDLQVHKLIPISESVQFSSAQKYVIKTKSDNLVRDGEKISEDDSNSEAYYLITGKPEITLKFPYSEILLIFVMIIIIVRLLLKKE